MKVIIIMYCMKVIIIKKTSYHDKDSPSTIRLRDISTLKTIPYQNPQPNHHQSHPSINRPHHRYLNPTNDHKPHQLTTAEIRKERFLGPWNGTNPHPWKCLHTHHTHAHIARDTRVLPCVCILLCVCVCILLCVHIRDACN